eukprot:CAMPEP_0198229352 /NCGR_PEP_ID=MMETSP1445-20131203/114078_1 /TAXON_ID=36898 /ORGANISM="Pyramimonas sp., Strain CCMP2087" /LENGTH=139 /DNA_ID=CAMNT_0043909809 /DNA_START=509 /DNA_END=928 /DNA_ORIENTATION=-
MAKIDLAAGSMIIEYRGQNVRESVANIREKKYNKGAHDCFLLKVDGELVMDATHSGCIARFTNHSCNPNMFTRILDVDTTSHTVFFARTAIAAGEELTYDYRMESEDTAMPCSCGAPNCRGSVDLEHPTPRNPLVQYKA